MFKSKTIIPIMKSIFKHQNQCFNQKIDVGIDFYIIKLKNESEN
jgi:hypothetical protein